MKRLPATGANLLRISSALDFAQKGYSLLDRKRIVLMQEMMSLNEEAEQIQKDIVQAFKKSYQALSITSLTMNPDQIEEVARSMPLEDKYEIGYRSVMGVEIPSFHTQESQMQTNFSLFETTTAFDSVYIELIDLREQIYQLAEIETAIFKLAEEIKKTQKRANALDKIQIPRYKKAMRNMESTLEENEREEFISLKKVKNL